MEAVRAPFGDELRRLREAAGLTQEQLAERAGLTAKGIAALERGRRQRPYPHTVAALADALALDDAGRAALAGSLARRDVAPAPATASASPLPEPLTSLIGREGEVAALAAILRAGGRLVTLTGPGGVGKTRLALAAASASAADFPGGTAFVPLAPLDDPALVLPAIAGALGLQDGGGSPLAALRAALDARPTLLVLDNCEHLLAAAPEVAELQASCPGLAILATSRAPLRLRGEREYAVAPLPLPAFDRLPTVAEIADNPAVRLFVARAREVAPDFALAQADAAAIAAICRRLDGLPLALELAAARVRALGPTELLARLDRALPILASGARDLPERQRTMERAIDWSYDLVEPDEARLFRCLAVFAGGWDLAAAEAVAGGGTGGGLDIFLALDALVEQSLVLAEDGADATPRYRLLEPVRQYAVQRLRESGESDAARARHADHYLALAERAGPALEGPEQGTWLARLEAEVDNVRAAIGWALGAERRDLVARLGWALHIFWAMRGHHREGRRWLETVLAGGGLDPADEARALAAAGLLARMGGDYEAAIARLGAALDRFRALGDTPAVLSTLSRLGHAARLRGDYGTARALAEEGLALARAVGDSARIVWMLDVLGLVALAEGEFARATVLYEEALPLARATGDARYIAALPAHLALAALALGDHARADGYGRVGLASQARLGVRRSVAVCLDLLACVAAARGEDGRAARLFGAADGVRDTDGLAHWSAADRALYDPYLAPLRARLGEAAYEANLAAGRALPQAEAVALALSDGADL